MLGDLAIGDAVNGQRGLSHFRARGGQWPVARPRGGRVCDEPRLHLVALGDHVTGPFDMKLAPNARGLFRGDYMGLEAIGDDLLAFFATTQGDSANVYSVRANR